MKKFFSRFRVWKLLLCILIALAAAALICYGIIIARAPKIQASDVVPKAYRTSILDQEGTEIRTLSKEASNRDYVSEDQIPDVVKHAFIAIEDERFYEHNGVDQTGILRAIFQGIKNGGFSEGASTITQQLIKNNVLTDWTREDSFAKKFVRKLQEQHLARELEKQKDKEWILMNYLNTINLGNGTWGIQAASRSYFGKDASELNASEAAVLAAIPKSPTEYNPILHPKSNKTRRKIVLKKMLEQGYLTQEEYDAALKDKVYERISKNGTANGEAETLTWFEDLLVRNVEEDLEKKLGLTSEEAWDQLYAGGLTIESTVNTGMQKAAQKAARAHGKEKNASQLSIVLLDAGSGEIRAIVGGSEKKTGNLVYNRAVDSIRQPGSTLKIIGEYAAGMEDGSLTLGTVMDDAPYSYSDGTSLTNANGKYGGKTTIRRAITTSNNVIAVKCLQQIGIQKTMETIEGFGISTLDKSDQVESLALGGTTNGVTNLELTAAYAAIARGGTRIAPRYYTRVLDRDGNVILESEMKSQQCISKDTSLLLTDAMRDVITEGTGTAAAISGLDLAGKSGTTSQAKDAWFIGFSSELVCGVWGGYDDHSTQKDTSYVKEVWKTVMEQAHSGMKTDTLGIKKDEESTESSGSQGGFWFSNPVQTTTEREDGLVSCRICTKCGKLAVNGLCEDTVQGDMTATEYYRKGTEPTQMCDCHVRVRESDGGLFSFGLSQKVYLREGTAGTDDEAYVQPKDSTQNPYSQPDDSTENPYGQPDDSTQNPYSQPDGGSNDPDSRPDEDTNDTDSWFTWPGNDTNDTDGNQSEEDSENNFDIFSWFDF